MEFLNTWKDNHNKLEMLQELGIRFLWLISSFWEKDPRSLLWDKRRKNMKINQEYKQFIVHTNGFLSTKICSQKIDGKTMYFKKQSNMRNHDDHQN
jgi:hypothetical protein